MYQIDYNQKWVCESSTGVNVNKARKGVQRMLCQEHDSYSEPVDLNLSSFVCVQLPAHDTVGFASFHFLSETCVKVILS